MSLPDKNCQYLDLQLYQRKIRWDLQSAEQLDDEYYVHRIGRTGRAGREGKAFSLVVGKEVYKLRDIQRYCKFRIQIDEDLDIADKIIGGAGEPTYIDLK